MFKIDSYDFKLDTSTYFNLDGGVLNCEIMGEQTAFDEIVEDEMNPYSWALYPPKLYIRELPIEQSDADRFEYSISQTDLDNCDIGLYMMEHYTIFPCKIKGSGSVVIVEGLVHELQDSPVSLCVELKLNEF